MKSWCSFWPTLYVHSNGYVTIH